MAWGMFRLVGLVSGIFFVDQFSTENGEVTSNFEEHESQVTPTWLTPFWQVLMMDTSNHMKAQLTKQHDVGTSIFLPRHWVCRQAFSQCFSLTVSNHKFLSFCCSPFAKCGRCIFFVCTFCSLVRSSSGLASGGSQILRDFERRHRSQSFSGSWWLLLVAAVEEEKHIELSWTSMENLHNCLSFPNGRGFLLGRWYEWNFGLMSFFWWVSWTSFHLQGYFWQYLFRNLFKTFSLLLRPLQLMLETIFNGGVFLCSTTI